MTVGRIGNILSTNVLREHIKTISVVKTGGIRVIETTWSPDTQIDVYKHHFLPSHIPTSQYFDFINCAPRSEYFRRSVPDINKFTDIAQSLGINNDTHIITYDRTNSLSSIRTWWLLRLYGHRKVSVLDGGFKKWLNDGFEVSDESANYKIGNFEGKLDKTLIRDYEDMCENVVNKKEQVVDARNSLSFQGEDDMPSEAKKGHIPGAKNIPYSSLFNSDGTYKSQHELKLLFDGASIDLGQPVTAMCETGLTACGLVMAGNMLGKETIPVYAGSMYEWGQRAPEDLCVKGNS
ncbi:hypothetical protein LOTGIDRAFT_218175 [Lottia gigantea]|uniref:Rhodanese domain-containing protein n=1 Tax=Lottia gigantea TaxID=225164 RepID=V4A9Z3_LOTGI|nr:hypothetical protein LOTGIDRAFT_218175 [Lottia gigantea]ESO90121.1 hypothetical protein LOTGIDRAFT_218175 [Lottia gigantea]